MIRVTRKSMTLKLSDVTTTAGVKHSINPSPKLNDRWKTSPGRSIESGAALTLVSVTRTWALPRGPCDPVKR
jgi:hypothetical protein